ncbi:hypothetical protein BSY18_4102 (plasmid) [Blastomonas sp. RAC04]|nr:hypothetical protein BSY18_4102 [Blastomonas sp. RAC04]
MNPPVVKQPCRSDTQIAEQLSLRDHPNQLGVVLIVRMWRLCQCLGFLLDHNFDLGSKLGPQPLGERK